MTYAINPRVEQDNRRRMHAPELAYVGKLQQEGGLLELDNILVDVEQLLLRTFQCDTDWCIRCAREDGQRRYRGSCCTDLQVDLTPGELKRLSILGRHGAEHETLADGPLGKVIDRLTENRFTTETDRGDVILNHLPRSGRCPLSWIDTSETMRCGINTLCEVLNLPLTDFKPEPCFLFPLHYVEFEPERFLLTLISLETYRYIGADRFVGKLRCLRRPQPGMPPAYVALQGEITHCLGAPFYAALAAAAPSILAARAAAPREAVQ